MFTIVEEPLGELTDEEQKLMDADWSDFKNDVSMKTLVNTLDRAIKRRRRLYVSHDTIEEEYIANFRKQYDRYKPLKLISLTLYILLPFFEKPGWCIKSASLDHNTTEGYWYCNTVDKTIANSNLPKLPSIATNLIYIVSLIIIWAFTKMRDVYRKRDEHDRVEVQFWLIGVAIANLVITIIVICIPWEQDTRDNNLFVRFFIYPYINAFIRPVLFSLCVRSIKSFWRRYIQVIVGSLPMGIFIFLYVFYFAWMGNRLFAGTIEGVENFGDLNDSFFYMFVLLTTSNFPDVMLPSYA